MIKDKSLSAHILPIRNGLIAFLDYDGKGYGPIGGRVDDGEDLYQALRRELDEEIGLPELADNVIKIDKPYSFKHSDPERAMGRGALSEEHHFFIAKISNNMNLEFIEPRLPNVKIIWVSPVELATKKYLYFDNLCEYYMYNIIPAII
ncbi:NUDIX domain-containing protein [Lachnospiraceae bacterium OttesenSCG-928-E19]|nr:NUDIX domain-containing protein [Lachnospiraceae bacterium OttesenSCG-928-E19]